MLSSLYYLAYNLILSPSRLFYFIISIFTYICLWKALTEIQRRYAVEDIPLLDPVADMGISSDSFSTLATRYEVKVMMMDFLINLLIMNMQLHLHYEGSHFMRSNHAYNNILNKETPFHTNLSTSFL